jgi:hypothetical protein
MRLFRIQQRIRQLQEDAPSRTGVASPGTGGSGEDEAGLPEGNEEGQVREAFSVSRVSEMTAGLPSPRSGNDEAPAVLEPEEVADGGDGDGDGATAPSAPSSHASSSTALKYAPPLLPSAHMSTHSALALPVPKRSMF